MDAELSFTVFWLVYGGRLWDARGCGEPAPLTWTSATAPSLRLVARERLTPLLCLREDGREHDLAKTGLAINSAAHPLDWAVAAAQLVTGSGSLTTRPACSTRFPEQQSSETFLPPSQRTSSHSSLPFFNTIQGRNEKVKYLVQTVSGHMKLLLCFNTCTMAYSTEKLVECTCSREDCIIWIHTACGHTCTLMCRNTWI